MSGPEHRSRRLTAGRISRAQLVLATDAQVKSTVLRADLQARDKLFTLLEAAILARGVMAALADSRDGRPAANGLKLAELPRRAGDPRLSWLVSEMDAARGLVVPDGRNRNNDTMDIRDPHGGRRSPSHRKALRTLSDAVASLSASMQEVHSS